MTEREIITVSKTGWSRGITDADWERIEPIHIALWRDAQIQFFPRKLTVGERRYVVSANLEPVIESLKRNYGVMRRLYPDVGIPDVSAVEEFSTPKSPVTFEVVQETGDGKINGHMAEHLVQTTLYDLFMIMNIAAAGSCDFYRAIVTQSDSKQNSEIEISNQFFESASLHVAWPVLNILPFESVLSWFDSARSETAQLAQNATEKVIFSIWHLCQIDASPVAIVWIFYALETLLCSQPGDSFSVIRRRLEIMLRPSEARKSELKRRLRTLYDLRSSFVHGGSGMFHPMRNEVLDKRADDQYTLYSESIDFGMTLIVSLSQTMVNLRVPNLTFKETLDLGL